MTYRVSPAASQVALEVLVGASWPGHIPYDFGATLRHSTGYGCTYAGDPVVGFVHGAWDGGLHARPLDTTAHPRLGPSPHRRAAPPTRGAARRGTCDHLAPRRCRAGAAQLLRRW